MHDPRGDLIPNLRRENFVVYDGGIKQTTATVDVEHSPVTLAVLLEAGGRYQQLNGFLRSEILFLTRPLLDALIRDDKLAVLAYADRLETLIDFEQPGVSFDPVIDRLATRGFSETNLYDFADRGPQPHGGRPRRPQSRSSGVDRDRYLQPCNVR